jgi:hypothetical protein
VIVCCCTDAGVGDADAAAMGFWVIAPLCVDAIREDDFPDAGMETANGETLDVFVGAGSGRAIWIGGYTVAGFATVDPFDVLSVTPF